MWKLVIEDDEGNRTLVPLTRDDYSIGRQDGNTIRLTERNVSRQHGRIRRRRSGTNGSSSEVFTLEDRDSYNGIFLNGLRVAEDQDLQHGDLIQIGDYRIVLQDESATSADIETGPQAATQPDAKSTVPMASAFRGQLLTERPHRLVMLVGPTPGVEFVLDRERMTVGRADDATISVNHNSVSRVHCEVHSLGNGRFEIVDKASSNGVRVNGVELKRSIIEAGDVIELGDVRFKFVGAGQVFVPGPNESQQLAAIADREPEIVSPPAPGLSGYALPVALASLMGVAVILAGLWLLRARSRTENVVPTVTNADVESQLVQSARAACTVEDCEAAHLDVTTRLPPQSAWRESPEFQQIETLWAESVLRRAQKETDPTARRALLLRVVNTPTVDAFRRKAAHDQLAALEEPTATPSELPVATPPPSETPPTEPVPVSPSAVPTTSAPRPPNQHRHPVAVTTADPTARPVTSTVRKPPTAPSTTASASASPVNRALKTGDPAAVRSALGPIVRSGRATRDQVHLYKAACQELGDFKCTAEVRQRYPEYYPPP